MGSTTRILAAVIGLVAIGLGALYAIYALSPAPAGPDLARSKPTEKGVYVATVAPAVEPVEIGQMHAWTLTLATPDGTPVAGAKVAVDGGMPEHNHGLPTSPEVTAELGNGRYTVDGMKFNMSGWWVLRFRISSPAGDDDVAFNLKL